jgi:hypothetical protein
MPNCFQLLRDDDAMSFNEIDEALCRHFNEPCHQTLYYQSWYDTIGYGLAVGWSFDQIRTTYADFPKLVEITDWIEANFTVRHWHERRGHERDPADIG